VLEERVKHVVEGIHDLNGHYEAYIQRGTSIKKREKGNQSEREIEREKVRETEKQTSCYSLIFMEVFSFLKSSKEIKVKVISQVFKERVKHVVEVIHDLGDNYVRHTEEIKDIEKRE